MDFIWNTSLKNVQVQILAQKMPKKSPNKPEKKTGLSIKKCQLALVECRLAQILSMAQKCLAQV